MVDLEILEEVMNPSVCEGMYFRGKVSHYRGSDGCSFHQRKSLQLLKKRSCFCEQCLITLDDIGECSYEVGIDFNGIEDGAVYMFVFVEDGRDWETNYLEEWHYKLVKVEETYKTY